MPELRYKAFISYSHQDADWSAWLQRALESYRVPRRLVGTQGEFGTIGSKVAPIFRDREDLASATDLSVSVRDALMASECLLVVCSPAAVQSEWVDQEIQTFRQLGRGDRIFALVVEGEPGSDIEGQNCFPSQLLLDDEGRAIEPLAADARKWADGKHLAKLKVVSAILGIRLDDLRRRDLQRRQRVWTASIAAMATLTVVMAVLAITAITARYAAENRREHAEDLVGYMVGDLRSKLDEVGRLDILEGMGGRVGEYLQTLDPAEVTDESLTQQAKVWRQLGEVAMDQGNLDEALQAFTASRDILAELQRRDPTNPDRVFELGNAEFWVGYAWLDKGDFDRTQTYFDAYLLHASRLNELKPNDADAMMELSYAHINLAALIEQQGQDKVGEALEHITAALDIARELMAMEPANEAWRSEYAETLAWHADVQLMACNLGEALESRQEQVVLARELAESSPGNINLKRRYAYSLTGLSTVAIQVGLTDMAVDHLSASREVIGELSRLEPSNKDFAYQYPDRLAQIAGIKADTGQLDSALLLMSTVEPGLRAVVEEEAYENAWRAASWVNFMLSWSDMFFRSGDAARATELLEQAKSRLASMINEGLDPEAFRIALLSTRFQYWQLSGDDLLQKEPFRSVELPSAASTGCNEQAVRFRQAILEGNNEEAQRLARSLLQKGYYEPGFVRICREFGQCSN